MKKKNLFCLSLSFFILSFSSIGQDCGCTVQEVESNTVNSCDYTIGEVINVSSEDEFIAAVNEANSGGGNVTILIEDGTYEIASVDWYPYVTASNIVFRSQSGNRDNVILTGSGMADVSPGTEIGIYAVGDNITIADLTIKDVGNHGITVTGDNLFVHNVKIQNTFEQMIKGNGVEGGINNGTVQCSLFEYSAGIGPQWYIGGLDIHTGIDWNVRDNVFKNIISPSIAVAEHAVHFWDSSADNIVERNVIENCDRGIGFGLGDSPNEGGIIRNNMIYNNGEGSFHDIGIGLESSPNTKVYNNSIYIEYMNAIEYRFVPTTDVVITNNLTNKPITLRDGGSAALVTNYTTADATWFEDLFTSDLRLVSNIPELVEAGTDVEEVAVDIDQTPRPQMTSFDIGAHEYIHPLSISEVTENADHIRLYPNPTNTTFNLTSASTPFNRIQISNATGQVIATYEYNSSLHSTKIDAYQWSPGIYYCRLSFAHNTDSQAQVIIID